MLKDVICNVRDPYGSHEQKTARTLRTNHAPSTKEARSESINAGLRWAAVDPFRPLQMRPSNRDVAVD